jgi:hypothetical protein
MPMGLSASGSNDQGMGVAGWGPLVLSAETFQAVTGGDIDTPHGLYIARDPLRDSPNCFDQYLQVLSYILFCHYSVLTPQGQLTDPGIGLQTKAWIFRLAICHQSIRSASPPNFVY